MSPRNMGRCFAGDGSVEKPPEIGETGGETLYLLRGVTFSFNGRVSAFISMYLNALIVERRKKVDRDMSTSSVLRLHPS